MSELRAKAKNRSALAEAELLSKLQQKETPKPSYPIWLQTTELERELIYLIVDYNKKDIARNAGARWDPKERHWWFTLAQVQDEESLEILRQFAAYKKVKYEF